MRPLTQKCLLRQHDQERAGDGGRSHGPMVGIAPIGAEHPLLEDGRRLTGGCSGLESLTSGILVWYNRGLT